MQGAARAVRASVRRRRRRERSLRHAGTARRRPPRRGRVSRVADERRHASARCGALIAGGHRAGRRRRTAPARRLPLSRTSGDCVRGSIFVVLPTSGAALQPGPYYTPHVTPLAALRAVYGDRVVYERGCGVTGDDPRGVAAAVDAARDASVAV